MHIVSNDPELKWMHVVYSTSGSLSSLIHLKRKTTFYLSAWFDRFVVFHALMKYDNQNQIVGVFSPTIVDLTSHWMASFSVYKKISFVWSFDSFWFTAKFYECQSYVCFYTVMFLNNVFCCCNIQLWSYLFRWQIKLFF